MDTSAADASASEGSVLDLPTLLTLGAVGVALGRALHLLVTRGPMRDRGSKPSLHYQEGSRLCEEIISRCRTLQESYVPPLLWGWNGHAQTILFSVIGRFSVPDISGERQWLRVEDGSTVSYDIFEPDGESRVTHTILVCPGIGNTSETDYMKVFACHAVQKGYRVAVLNHLGSLPGETLTGNRIFTYGGTGDFTAMYDDVRSRFPDNKLIGIGLSMGACILIRFLGEEPSRQQHFVCAASVGQGYDPALAVPYSQEWTNFRRLYNAGIAKKQLNLLRRHRDSLFTVGEDEEPTTSAEAPSTAQPTAPPAAPQTSEPTTAPQTSEPPRTTAPQTTTSATPGPSTSPHHGRRDSNGFSLDPSHIQPPDLTRVWSASSLYDVDEYYTRRVMGFTSPMELYRWTSCVDAMYRITELPLLLVNSRDDPIVPEDIHRIPREYAVGHSNAMFVVTDYGGHLGFFEGGIVKANTGSWIDRLLLEYMDTCVHLFQETEV